MIEFLPYRNIWVVDFEYHPRPGEIHIPICMVAKELRTGQTLHLWQDELLRLPAAPYSLGEESLFVIYSASGDLLCHLALGWELPKNILDLYVEFRCLTNGLILKHGASLIGAQLYFELETVELNYKGSMQDLAIRGGPYTDDERMQLLKYCESDVLAAEGLLHKMEQALDLPRALVRGCYQKSVAKMEHNGIPIDLESLMILKSLWNEIKHELVRRVDTEFDVYEGVTFKLKKFEQLVSKHGINWSLTDKGNLKLDRETFKNVSEIYPFLKPLGELRRTLTQLKSIDLPVGRDGRNRTALKAFGAKTSRNTPSGKCFIFLLPTWMRSLIKPEVGRGLAYVDWEQQEFGIAAALSRDSNMLEAYRSGDPYLAFAKQAHAVPANATKETHKRERDRFKGCALGVLYGMGVETLSSRTGLSISEAKDLTAHHHNIYQTFWNWSTGVVNCAAILREVTTTLGWKIQYTGQMNERSVMNFPIQTNGAEMMRLACIKAIETNIRIIAPVHDALLIEFYLDKTNESILNTREIMAEASSFILDGFELRTEVKTILYPDRYTDGRGVEMWDLVWDIVSELEKQDYLFQGTC
jgi:DNA polymerase I